MNAAVPLPTQRTSLTKISKASHSGFSNGSINSLKNGTSMVRIKDKLYKQQVNNELHIDYIIKFPNEMIIIYRKSFYSIIMKYVFACELG